jgi:cell division protein ZipA
MRDANGASEHKSLDQELPPERIVTVRLTAHGHSTFAGNALVSALLGSGLRHGRFGIFHRHDPQDDNRIFFSVASLVEPGTFDLGTAASESFPGVSLFLQIPNRSDPVLAFDDMMRTARELARQLDGELLDEQGSRLSVQRERYLREEILQLRRKPATPA